MTPRQQVRLRLRALAQLEAAARSMARAKRDEAALLAQLAALPVCSEGDPGDPRGTACWAHIEGDRPLEREYYCDNCKARQAVVDPWNALRRKHGGYMRAILAAARKLEREP